jgi:hypothetical protein
MKLRFHKNVSVSSPKTFLERIYIWNNLNHNQRALNHSICFHFHRSIQSSDVSPSCRSCRLSSQAPRKADSVFPLRIRLRRSSGSHRCSGPQRCTCVSSYRAPTYGRCAVRMRGRGFLRSPCKHIIKHLPCTTDCLSLSLSLSWPCRRR